MTQMTSVPEKVDFQAVEVVETTNYAIVHLRCFKPLSVGFPAPGVYNSVLLVLPDLEPSILSRISSARGSQPAGVFFDFGFQVHAAEVLEFIKKNLEALENYHASFASPIQRSIFFRLRVTSTRPTAQGPVAGPIDPLEEVPEFINND